MNNENKPHNQKLRRNARIFGILMILSQIAFSLIYSYMYTINHTMLNISSVINTIGLSILIIAGFGLLISYHKRLIWSGLGFTFFITALSIELYPLVNAFWTKTRINYTATINDFSQSNNSLFLMNSALSSDKLYGNSITNGFKCALAVTTAFSSILGRAGPLQCYITTIIGTIGFQLNRQIINNLSNDSFGTYFIFTYGGFMGLAIGVMLRVCKEKIDIGSSTAKNNFNQGSVFSACFALLGSLIIFAFFPMLSYEVDNTNHFNTFYLQTGPISLLLGMSSSLIASFCISSLINQSVIIRDIIHAPVAGGIVVGSASFFISNPVYAIVAGFAAGTIQCIIQNFIQKPWMKSNSIISTISWSLFGIQGIIGSIFATGYQNIVNSNQNNLIFDSITISKNGGYQLLIGVISAGIGLGFGIITGLLLILVSGHKSKDYFVDQTYWINDDGTAFLGVRNEKTHLAERKISRVQKMQVYQQTKQQQINIIEEKKEQFELELKQKNVRIEYSEVVPWDPSTPNFQMSFSQPQPEKQNAYL